jgi:hypothetical protein
MMASKGIILAKAKACVVNIVGCSLLARALFPLIRCCSFEFPCFKTNFVRRGTFEIVFVASS